MQRRIKYQSRAAQIVLGICGIAVLASTGHAQSFGLNFQNDAYGFGPWFISDFGPAYGVAGDDWYNTQFASSSFDPNSSSGAVSFSSPSMNGASASLAWASSNSNQASTVNAYGWSHANEPTNPSNGLPASAEEAVLGGFVYAEYNPTSGQGAKIQVRISGLGGIATAAGVPLSYQVKLLASDDWGTADNYTPAMVQDSASNMETLNFNLVDLDHDSIADHPRWNEAYFSSGGMADSTTIFTGDTLNITLAGPNEFGTFDQPGYGRTALAGVAVYFVPPSAVVPEPSALALGCVGAFLIAVCWIGRRSQRLAQQYRLCRVLLPVAAGVGFFGASVNLCSAQSFGVHWQNNYYGFGPWNVSDFGTAFGVDGNDWYNSNFAVSDDDTNSDPTGVVPFSAPSMNGASVNLKWSSDRFWGGQASPGYAYSHANEPDLPDDGITPGLPSNAEEAVLASSLISTYDANTGFGQKIQITLNGLGAVAAANGVPLQYTVKLMASDFGLPKSFYVAPFGSTNPAPGKTVDHFAPALVQDNAAHSESVALSVLPYHPVWQSLGQIDGWDPQAPYYGSGAVGDSATVFTGDSLTITLDGPFDFGGNWEDPSYGVTRLAGFAVYFVGNSQTGDFDGDGDVDGADFVAWQTHYPTASGATQAMGDADGNGTVDGADFAIWQGSFPTAPSPTAAVPEPSAILLFVVGACALAGYRRRQRLTS